MAGKLKLLVALAALPLAPPVVAQNNSATTGQAHIVGVVIDSLSGGFLSGADVIVQGSPALAKTDSLGRFRVDSLTPGMYQVGVYHPRLDTLGLMLATQPFRVGPDSSSTIVLAVPAAESIIRATCPAQSGGKATSAIIGHVNDPETLQPVVGAEVTAVWDEIEVSGKSDIRRTPRSARAVTNKSGAYVLCGLPSSLNATLQARRGLAETAEIPIALSSKPMELVGRTLLLSPRDSWRENGNATVSGVVVLEGSATNAGSRVELVGTDIVVRTNDDGEFTMRNLPSGSHTLLARHVGFGAEIVPVDLSSRQPKRVTIKLPKFVAVMNPVLVTARRMSALERVGFVQRQKARLGYFLGPDRFQNIHLQRVTDIFQHVPVVRDKCVQYWVDDTLYQELEPGDINFYLSGSEIVAAEVYDNLRTPARYMRFGGCTIVVLWTQLKIPAS